MARVQNAKLILLDCFLNSSETLLTNEIVWGLVLVSNFFPIKDLSVSSSSPFFFRVSTYGVHS